MITDELKDYIQKELNSGKSREQITEALLYRHWSDAQITEGFAAIGPISVVRSDSSSEIPASSVDPAKIKPKKSKRKFVAVIGLIVFLLVAGVSVAMGMQYYYAPERVVARAAQKMESISTFSYEGKLTIRTPEGFFDSEEITESLGEFSSIMPANYTVEFSGIHDLTDPEKLKSQTSISLTAFVQKIFEAEIRTFPETMYMKLDTLNDFGFLDSYDIVNKWFSLDFNRLATYLGKTEDLESYRDNYQWTREKQTQIFVLAKKHKIITMTKQRKSQTVDGQEMRVYGALVNKDKLPAFIKDYAKIVSKEENIEESELRKLVEQIEFQELEIWIEKKDNFMYRIDVPVTFMIDSSERIETRLVVSMKDFNQKIDIPVPTDAIDVFTFIETLRGSLQEPNEISDPSNDPSDIEHLSPVDEISMFPTLLNTSVNSRLTFFGKTAVY